MGPAPRENTNDRSNDENYEQDGWYVGYEVQMEGLGVVNVYGEANNSDSDSDGYIGPENDSDDEHSETRRMGYMTVPSNLESDNEEDNKKVEEDQAEMVAEPSSSGAQVLAPVQKAFQNALNDAQNVHLTDKDFKIDSTSKNDILLSQDKINEIKLSMANFKLQKPEWIDADADEKIFNFINKKT